jgi:hypothetical protein
MNESEQDAEPRLEHTDGPDDHARLEVERARRVVGALKPGELGTLYIGPEGGAITETVLAALFAEFGVADLRTLAKLEHLPADTQAEDVFETVAADGTTLMLGRIRIDGGPLLELECTKRPAAV